jgi:1-acyl-sn-glycerol-3-phosphate acyltransferase
MSEAGALPPFSPWLWERFARFLGFYFRRKFNAVRIAADAPVAIPDQGPIIVCSNHPSWWDPITLLLVAYHCFPERRCYGPIDAQALESYPTLGRLGLFGVDRSSRRSLKQFLETCDAILAQPGTAIGLTAQGEFRDARDRPIELEAGIGHLLKRHPDAALIPIALEYPFWNESAPEALIRIGPPLPGDPRRAERSADDLRDEAAEALTACMDRLAELARSRDPSHFRQLIEGRKGAGGAYDVFRRLWAWVRGKRFDASHASAGRREER